MSQSSGYQYPLYAEPNNSLKNGPHMVNGQNSALQQNGMQPSHFNLTGTPSSQSSRDPSRETSRDPSPTQYLHNQYRSQMPRPPMPPISGSHNNVLSPPPRTSQSQPYAVPKHYATSSSQVMAVSTPSTIFVSPTSQEIHHTPLIPSNQPTQLTKNQMLKSESLTSADTVKPEFARPNQNYPKAVNTPSTNVSQDNVCSYNLPTNTDRTSQVFMDPTVGSQISFTKINQGSVHNQVRSVAPTSLNTNLPPSKVIQNLNQNIHHMQEPETSKDLQSTRTRNIQSQLITGPAESSVNPQLKHGSQQNIFSASSTSTSNTQNLFFSSPSSQNVTLRNPQDYYPQSSKFQQSLRTDHVERMTLSGIPQDQNIYQNLSDQSKYLEPNTANTVMLSPRMTAPSTGTKQLHARPLPSDMPLHPGQTHNPHLQYQMTNVPLESLNNRYTNIYPDQMNQLNSQMSNLNVAQGGFNKLWGMESVDLLQCRNILPAEKIEPPKIRLPNQEFPDTVNCNPNIFRCTLTKIPESNSLLQKSRLPFGILIHPFKDLNHLPVIQCSNIVRCRACRTYINPFVYFVDSKRWKCNLCFRLNELPEEFQFDPVTKSYGDPSRRPEVKAGTIEYIAPSEYMLRPPQPAVYLFIVDVSRLAVESGYLQIVCNTITNELSRLPGDSRTQIGFLAVDSALHFFSMPDNISQPHEMIMLDIDDVFLPCPENLVVNLKEREELVRDLLSQLPVKFCGTHDTGNALGAALQVAFKLLSATGGRVTVFQTCLPNLGPGALQPREDPNARASKDIPHLNPATDFYKRFALDCSGQQIAIDLFLLNSQYSDLSTLSCMSKFTGGCIFHLPLFRAAKLQNAATLERLFRRYLTRKIGFEAVMRIRCTRGISIHAFHGSFFVRSTDLLCLPNINPDAGFGMQISIDENLSDVQNVCFQAALLYTSSKGERRIRVHTLNLPVVSNLSDVLHSADQQCIVGLLSKMAVDRSLQSSLSDARDALINVAIDILSAYKLSQSTGTGGLTAPGNLKLLPLYIIALLKSVAFRSGMSTRLDDRVFCMFQLKTLPLPQLIQMIYPDLYPIHAFDDRNSKDIDGKVCPQPPRLHLSAEKLDTRSAFLMDAGDRIFIYVGKNINMGFCSNILGVSAFASIPEEFYELPELDTVESEQLRNFVFSLQEEKPFYAPLQIIRDDSHFRSLFIERLIEDRFESALSYYEFLQHLKTQVKE